VVAPKGSTRSADLYCDGVADYEELQLAINTVNAQGGGVVQLLDGVYIVNNKLDVLENVRLIGSSRETKIQDITAGLFMFGNSSLESLGVLLNSNTNLVLIADNVTISNCDIDCTLISSDPDYGVMVGDATVVKNNIITGCSLSIVANGITPNKALVYVKNADGFIFSNNKVVASGDAFGILSAAASTNINITGNDITSTIPTDVIRLDGAFCLVSNNTITHTPSASSASMVFLYGANSSFNNNICTLTVGSAFVTCHVVSISGANSIVNGNNARIANGGSGAAIFCYVNETQEAIISNNNIKLNYIGSAGTNGIYILGNAGANGYHTITGNVIFAAKPLGAPASVGITIYTSSRNTVSGNSVQGCDKPLEIVGATSNRNLHMANKWFGNTSNIAVLTGSPTNTQQTTNIAS
jgi:hypothetical protein